VDPSRAGARAGPSGRRAERIGCFTWNIETPLATSLAAGPTTERENRQAPSRDRGPSHRGTRRRRHPGRHCAPPSTRIRRPRHRRPQARHAATDTARIRPSPAPPRCGPTILRWPRPPTSTDHRPTMHRPRRPPDPAHEPATPDLRRGLSAARSTRATIRTATTPSPPNQAAAPRGVASAAARASKRPDATSKPRRKRLTTRSKPGCTARLPTEVTGAAGNTAEGVLARAAPPPIHHRGRATAMAPPARPSWMFHVKHPERPAGSSLRPARRSSTSASSCSQR